MSAPDLATANVAARVELRYVGTEDDTCPRPCFTDGELERFMAYSKLAVAW